MGIKVSGPDPKPQLFWDAPNPPIDGVLPFPETDSLALNTFNTPQDGPVKLPDNQAIPGIIPSPNVPIPGTSTVPPSRLMTDGIPAMLAMPGSPPDGMDGLGK
jgi:hypothetical protein